MMIKYLPQFKVTGQESYYKMKEELREIAAEIKNKNIVAEIQEECDLIQCIYTRWFNLGMDKESIEKAWQDHYKKETLRGRVVQDIPGMSKEEKIIENLLEVIATKERVIKELQEKIKKDK